jgi:hypothetical protein
MAHTQKPDFVFRQKGRVHLNWRGRQFSRLLAAKVCASAVVMLDTPCSEVVWRVVATHSIHQLPLHFCHCVPSHFNWSLPKIYKRKQWKIMKSSSSSDRGVKKFRKISNNGTDINKNAYLGTFWVGCWDHQPLDTRHFDHQPNCNANVRDIILAKRMLK